jgi:hypothetical protein
VSFVQHRERSLLFNFRAMVQPRGLLSSRLSNTTETVAQYYLVWGLSHYLGYRAATYTLGEDSIARYLPFRLFVAPPGAYYLKPATAAAPYHLVSRAGGR